MKTSMNILLLTGICLCLCLFNGCCFLYEKFSFKPKILAEGQVKDYQKQSINGALVVINYVLSNREDCNGRVSGLTDSQGNFKIKVPRSSKYVLNISKKEYGFISEIYEGAENLNVIPNKVYLLNKASVYTMDASEGGTVTVTNTQSAGSSSSQADWSEIPTGTLPLVLDDSGRVTGFTMPENLRQLWEEQLQNRLDLSAASVQIPGNALVNSWGAPPQGNVQVAISAIDIFAPEGMPGNDVAMTSRQEPGTMLSYGAINIDVYDDKRTYQLKKGEESMAMITMPIPEWRLKLQKEFPKRMPLLYYDEVNGVWKEDGVATLNYSGTAYTAQLTHFSSINMDIIKTGVSTTAIFNYKQTCVDDEVPDTDPIGSDQINLPFKVELIVRDELADGQPIYVRNRTVAASSVNCPGIVSDPCYIDLLNIGDQSIYTYAMALNRLPINSPAAMTVFDGNLTKGVFVFKTSPTGYQEITDGYGAVPSCEDIQKHGTLVAVPWTVDPKDLSFPVVNDDFLIAVCHDGNDYRLSIATNILSFDAFDVDGSGTDLVFTSVRAENILGDTLCDKVVVMSDTNFEMFSNTTTTDQTPGASQPPPSWRVQVFRVKNPPLILCQDSGESEVSPDTIDTFYFEFSYNSVNYNLQAELGTCVFTP